MKFEDIKKLHQKKFREELGFFLLEGEHLVQELQKASLHDARLRASEIYFTREYSNWASPLTAHVVNSRHMMQISETRSPQGIAAVVPLLAAPAPQPGGRAIYLHEIQDPGNLGTILRTLAWSVPTAWTCTTARCCAPAWAPSSMCRWKSMYRWIRCRRASGALPASTCRVSPLPRRHSASSTATSSAMKGGACLATH
jgi:hypothetical protein